jgi:glycosyltransferase involved in cell wall biosynthesis
MADARDGLRVAIYHNLPSGGAKRALFHLTKGLAGRHAVDVYTLSSADHAFCDLRPYVRRHVTLPFAPSPMAPRPFGRLNPMVRAFDVLRLRSLERRLASRIDAGTYDVVFVDHCQYGQSPGLLRFLRSPSIYFCQEPPRWLYDVAAKRPYLVGWRERANAFDPVFRLHRRWLRRSDVCNTRAATMVLTNSDFSRRRLETTYGVRAGVCRLGVDTRVFRPMPLAKGEYVISVGALTPHKGFDFVIRSLGCIPAATRPALVLVCNAVDPRERGFLDDLADSLGVRLTVRVGVADEELVQLYNAARLTVYAPVGEPFGLVPLESMACGTPIVGVAEAGVCESVRHERTGLLVERDPARFAHAVETLAADQVRRAEYARRGRADVEAHWSWEAAVRSLEERFLEVVAPRARSDADGLAIRRRGDR